MCLKLLLLCGILSQGVIGTFADENIKESSHILVRQKRVFSRIPGEDRRPLIVDIPYIVMIRHVGRNSCAGSILSRHVVITAYICFRDEVLQNHQVVSKSARSDHGTVHNITGIRKHIPNDLNTSTYTNGIALLIVEPYFDLGMYSTPIALHTGPLLPNTPATVSGWGYDWCGNLDHGTKYLKNLRSIKVPIMAHRECVNIYRPLNIEITDKDICTYHPQRHCGHIDGGAPLVVDGFLAGVHLWTGPSRISQNNPQYPDVFAVLQHSEYSQWIRTNMHIIETNLVNRHY